MHARSLAFLHCSCVRHFVKASLDRGLRINSIGLRVGCASKSQMPRHFGFYCESFSFYSDEYNRAGTHTRWYRFHIKVYFILSVDQVRFSRQTQSRHFHCLWLSIDFSDKTYQRELLIEWITWKKDREKELFFNYKKGKIFLYPRL